jgi:hypothetical protein
MESFLMNGKISRAAQPAAAMLSRLVGQAQISAELQAELQAHTGSQKYFRHRLNPSFSYTDGVRHFLRRAGGGAYWLVDILALQPEISRATAEHGKLFAVLAVDCGVAKLTVALDRKERDSYEGVVYERRIPFTDCPPGEWIFNLGMGLLGDRHIVVACLPSED